LRLVDIFVTCETDQQQHSAVSDQHKQIFLLPVNVVC